MVIHAATPATTHAPNRSSHRRTTRMGPPRARPVHTTATTASHNQYEEKWNSRTDIRSATWAMVQNSNPVRPIGWAMFSTEGKSDPWTPRTGRNSTMPGTPSRAPANPTSASGMQPITEPTAMARRARGNPSAGTSRAPVSRTRSPMARSPHSTAKSRPDSLRCSGGTGRMPHDGASRSSARSSRWVTVAIGSPASLSIVAEGAMQDHGPGHALQLDRPDLLEPDAVRPGRGDHVIAHQDLARLGLGGDPGGDVHRPAEVVAVAEHHGTG